LLAIAGCSNIEQPASLAFEVNGHLEDPGITEASALARSLRQPGVLYVINDSGADETIHAIDSHGIRLGEFELKDSKNKDWEDLASFELDGDPYVLVADIGDNEAQYESRSLYVFKEPKLSKEDTRVDWRIRFEYPNGPRDAEAIAVDMENERVLVLTKRDIPPVLYELPLRPGDDDRITATWLGPITSLPPPTRQDVEFAPKTNDWHWQPSAMDISADNRAAVILTSRAVYYYERQPGQDWFDALNTRPVRVSLGGLPNAEAVAFGDDQRNVYVTGENRHAALLHADFAALDSEQTVAITVMTFNVQNLFDNVDDPGKDDKAYLPLKAKQNPEHIAACSEIAVDSWRDECLDLDWSDAAVDHKLGALAATIRQVNDGQGADIIALQEVENVAILERLRTEYLSGLGYRPAILVEGDDVRGIDVAFLSKLPLQGEPVLHPLHLPPEFADRAGDVRGVLQADFLLPDGGVLTGFSVHFPAPFHPTEMRIAAYEHLAALRDALPADNAVFAAGDFNTTSGEAAATGLLDDYARPSWTLAHDVGCSDCPGSYFYGRDNTWSFLDMILFSPPRGENATVAIRADSVAIANGIPAQVSSTGTPERYRSATRTGVSDHWPMIAVIQFAEKQ